MSPGTSSTARRALVVAAILPILFPSVGGAQQGTARASWDPQEILRTEHYVRPPEVIERIVLAPRVDISFSAPNADRSWFLRTTGKDRGTVARYGRPHIYLAGLAIDVAANRARSLTTNRDTGLTLVNPRTGESRDVQVPAGASVSAPVWSPTGAQVAFIANFADASYAYVADAATGRSTASSRAPLLATLVTTVEWTADGRQLLVVQVPEGRGPAPTHGPGGIEDGPRVRLTGGKAAPQPVHWSLLEDPHDKALLKYHTTGQLALIDVAKRTVRRVGAPAMIRDVSAATDALHFRVTRMVEPFSYLVPEENFGTVQELWDLSGRSLATLARTALREERGGFGGGIGGGGANASADTGKRSIQWNPVGPGLVYLQSVIPATPRARPTAVRYMSWLPPFGPNDTKVLYEGGPQLTSVAWSADATVMFVTDSGAVSAIRVAEPTKRYALGRGVTLADENAGFGGGGGRGGNAPIDTVGTGGALATKRGPNGQRFVVVASDGRSVFTSGARSYGGDWHTRAPRPWLDRLDFESGQRTRILDSPADRYDRFVTALDDDHTQFIYTSQSATLIEDAYLRDTRANATRKLTNAIDVAPEVTQATRKRIQVTRPRDGTKLWVEVILPREWRRGIGTPGVIWFYPYEYASEAGYQRSKYNVNINQYPAVPAARPATATELWVAGGYVFIRPDVPIFGDSGKMNDNYTRDLKENLDAVLDAVVDSGFVQRDRVGLGGHSYGAFSTVNAMTLVPYFKAGIAGDGMYNRSLTPFGFQSERRNFYDAQETYLDMSPFFRADRISGALLMYHNLEDQNTGTAPLSSIRMMAALQGLGKEAALYLYPYEDHSVATYESDLDQWARWLAWFDVHVRGNGKEKATFTP